MNLPEAVSREDWLRARRALLEEEKAALRAKDALNTKRRNLPMVKVDKSYEFDGPDGRVSLLDLFDGQTQLIVQHFMFDPSWEDGCPSCTAAVDELSAACCGICGHGHTTQSSLARRWQPSTSTARSVAGRSRSTPRTAPTSTTTSTSRSMRRWHPSSSTIAALTSSARQASSGSSIPTTSRWSSRG